METSKESPPPEPFDAFAVLGLDRHLTLEDDAIESAWRELSKEHHPDAEGGNADHAALLNRAYQALHTPGNRLRHWLEIHGVERERQSTIDPDLMDLFAEVGALLESTDALLQKKKAATSALGQALLAESEMKTQQDLQALLGRLQQAQRESVERFPDFESALPQGEARAATTTLARLGFLEKWQNQVQDRIMTLIAG